ncbi:hypothetical protein G9464_18910 [Halostella sp. JP-L12]|uniref:hypothetical protein n=1 Tax=Halostella TaxID=1843185 RepID=UPI000EF7F86A|nr:MULTISPECIES: hypothetical protein [Halostella]NHN49643.1 hypothetical protein [Halostella sp. JP-L12]
MASGLPFPLSGTTLVTGPSNVGKTRLTARALESWVAERGPDGVVVLDFAPVVERDDEVLGGRLSRFAAIPERAWHGVLDAHAPRADGEDAADARRLAADNAARAETLLDEAPPDPAAVFVNDATIPFQHERGDPDRLVAYSEGATAVLNVFESDELGTGDAVSRAENAALARLRDWADREHRPGN